MTTDPLHDHSRLKARLRDEALVRRDGLDLDERLEWDQELAQRALEFLDGVLPMRGGAEAGPVSAYWPMGSEADPRPILEGLKDRGLTLCLPAMVGKRMAFRSWTPYEPIVPGGFGTLVPASDRPEVSPRILLVPMLAFDRRGYRIGYGKGYYDQALAALDGVLSVGIGYAEQEIAAVPDEPHDIALDWIVTERAAIRCG